MGLGNGKDKALYFSPNARLLRTNTRQIAATALFPHAFALNSSGAQASLSTAHSSRSARLREARIEGVQTCNCSLGKDMALHRFDDIAAGKAAFERKLAD